MIPYLMVCAVQKVPTILGNRKPTYCSCLAGFSMQTQRQDRRCPVTMIARFGIRIPALDSEQQHIQGTTHDVRTKSVALMNLLSTLAPSRLGFCLSFLWLMISAGRMMKRSWSRIALVACRLNLVQRNWPQVEPLWYESRQHRDDLPKIKSING